MAYGLLVGKKFVDTKSPETLIAEGYLENRIEEVFSEDLHIPDDAKDLLKHLLVIDPRDRLTAEETLNHRYFGIIM